MKKRKGILQKVSIVSAFVSFALAIVTGILLYFRIRSTGTDNPVSASLMASTFFFICVGFVFRVIGNTDMPSFRIDKPEDR